MINHDTRLRRMAARGVAAVVLVLALVHPRAATEAKLVRYPHYHAGRVVFTYLGDIWTADEKGQNVQRITVNRARDVYPRFSPDAKRMRQLSEAIEELLTRFPPR